MERRRRRDIALGTWTLLAVALAQGCDDGKPRVDTSMTEATVSGTVSVRGKPAEGGTILFNPSNSERIVATRSAAIGPDGKYTITTLTGGNQVSFDGEVAHKNPGVGLAREFVDVRTGANTADFDLLGAGGKSSLYGLPAQGKAKGRGRGRPAP